MSQQSHPGFRNMVNQVWAQVVESLLEGVPEKSVPQRLRLATTDLKPDDPQGPVIMIVLLIDGKPVVKGISEAIMQSVEGDLVGPTDILAGGSPIVQ